MKMDDLGVPLFSETPKSTTGESSQDGRRVVVFILPCCMDFCPLRIGLVPFSYMAMILTTGSSHGMILRSAFGKNQLPYHIARSFFWPRVTKIKGRSVNGSWDKSTHLAIYKDIIKLLYMLAFIFETSKRYLDHNPLYTLNNQGPCFIAQRTWSTWVPYTSDTQACFFSGPMACCWELFGPHLLSRQRTSPKSWIITRIHNPYQNHCGMWYLVVL